MRVKVYGAKKDEYCIYEKLQKETGIKFEFTSDVLTMDTVDYTKGYDALIILTNCKVNHAIASKLKENGVKMIAARSAGTDHIDLNATKKNNIMVANVPYYSPQTISEYTILMLLALVRNMKKEQEMLKNGDFSLNGLKGKQIGSMKIGVFGTGRIGRETIKLLNAFGAHVLAYDIYENDVVKSICKYEKKDAILAEADAIILHCPLTEESYHFIDRDAISAMKDGVYIINTARGGLVDAESVLEGIKNKKIAGYGFDVYEYENIYIRKKFDLSLLDDDILKELLEKENVIYSSHMAFYSDKAIENLICVSVENIHEYFLTGKCKNEVV